MEDSALAQIYNLFADLLEYPTPALSQQARACAHWIAEMAPEAAVRIDQFLTSVEALSIPRLEEIYTRTFDMQPVCYPYVGYHLFGESYKRSAFMAQLNEGYRKYGFTPGTELPDHVAVILRFLGSRAAGRNSDFGRTLIDEGLVPTLEKIAKDLSAQTGNPYSLLISALLIVVKELVQKEMIHV